MDNIATAQNVSKKEIRQLVYNKLSDALLEFMPLIKRKKFDNKVQKAAKLFASDLIKASRKGKLKIKEVSEAETQQDYEEDQDELND